jgi:putative membrane protein
VKAQRGLGAYAVIGVKGMAMGAADVVPGVSGGTIALITGIYEELLSSLKGLTPDKLLVLVRQGPLRFWSSINGNFLFSLFAGILLSVLTLAAAVTYCLENYPLQVWGFFSGLILSSCLVLVRQQASWAWQQILALIIGALLVLGIGVLKPMELPFGVWILFFGGFIAICAMILPGISGSFLLLMMGLYPQVLRAVHEFDVLALAIFVGGCVSGLLVFSRFLSWLLARYHDTTLALMIGFLIGSLYTTWPWKEVLARGVDRHGEPIVLSQKSVMPASFDGEPMVASVILFASAACFLILMVEFLSKKFSESHN